MARRPPHPLASPSALPSTWPCLHLEGQGDRQRVVIDLSISPNAKRSEAVGWHDGALRVRIMAPPVDGAANDAVRRWLSVTLDLPLAGIELIRGATSRRKQWALHTPLAQIEGRLAEMINAGQIPAPTL